jgi:DNA repair exonuclease SbcCD nuclease subunit
MARLRLFHTADVHLGRSSRAFGAAAADHRRRLEQAFERCVACCAERHVQLFIVAGDLFDSPHPPESVAQRVRTALGRLADSSPPVVTVLVPGTHDRVVAGSIYQRWLGEGLPGGVHLLTHEQPIAQLPRLDAAVVFADSAGRLRRDPAASLSIGVLHGSVQIPGLVDADEIMVTQEQIASSGLDYLALGHWHSFADYSHGGVTALYPGSPEIVGLDEAEQGHALVVELADDAPPSWERAPTGTLRYEQRQFDLADFGSTEELIQDLLGAAGADVILDARLTGLPEPDLTLDLDEMLGRLEEHFFRVRLTDESQPEWADAEPQPPGLVSARFRQLMRERFDAAQTDEERRTVIQAQRLGLALLAGREVLR